MVAVEIELVIISPPSEIFPKNDDEICIQSVPDYNGALQDKLESLTRKKQSETTINDIYEVMAETSKYISEQDAGVNDRVFKEIIKL